VPPQIHSIALVYPETDFQTIVLTYPSILRALVAREPTFVPLPPHANPFYPRHVAGRGVGLFAAHALAPGDVIIIERPTLVQASVLPMRVVRSLTHLLHTLPAPQRLSAALLASFNFGDEWGASVMRTNAFEFDLPVPRCLPEEVAPWCKDSPVDLAWHHGMLFLTAARLNHSYVQRISPFICADVYLDALRTLVPFGMPRSLRSAYARLCQSLHTLS
jgi:hypothetical protein